MRSREFEETRIFLHFYLFCRREFPGILEKGDPRFRRKLEIVVDLFRGKIWIGSREFRETRIFLHFYTLYRTQLPGISEKVGPIFRRKFEIVVGTFRGKI